MVNVLSAGDLESIELDRVSQDKKIARKLVSNVSVLPKERKESIYGQRLSKRQLNSINKANSGGVEYVNQQNRESQRQSKVTFSPSVKDPLSAPFLESNTSFSAPNKRSARKVHDIKDLPMLKKPISNFKMLKKLGRGQFGDVKMYSVDLPNNKKLRFACKVQDITGDPEDYKYLRSECQIHGQMDNNFIVQLYHHYWTGFCSYFIQLSQEKIPPFLKFLGLKTLLFLI